MEQEIAKYIITVVIAGFLSLMLGIYVYLRQKNGPGVKAYIWVTITSSVYAFAYAFELGSQTLDEIKFWLKVEYLGQPLIPVFVLIMCAEYAGLKKFLTKKVVFSLFVIPVITILMHYTNDFHHLFYKSMSLVPNAPSAIVDLEKGGWYFIHFGYTLSTIIVGVTLLFMQWENSQHRFRMQILSMSIGLIIPVVAAFFYQAGLSPYGIDLAPVSMTLSYIFQGAKCLMLLQ